MKFDHQYLQGALAVTAYALLGVALSGTTYGQLVGLWEFENSNDLTASTIGSTLALSGTDLAVAGSGGSDTGGSQLDVGDYYTATHGIAPNGGGEFVNEWTLVFDVSYPAESFGSWMTFYQTSSGNSNDGEAFIRPSGPEGAIGVGSTGYSTEVTGPNTWYRVVFSVDLGNFHKTYVDGVEWIDGGAQAVDERFSFDPIVHFFADENGDDATISVSNVGLFDRPLSPFQVSTLGVAGDPIVFTENPVLELMINRDDGTMTLNNANVGQAQAVQGYSILSPAGALLEANYTPLADGDSDWIQFTAGGATSDLSEGHLTTGSIADGASIMLDNGTNGAWTQYFDESEIRFEYLDGNGNLIEGDVAFTGNGGAPFEIGDLDLDGDVDVHDWLDFTSEFGSTNLAGLSIAGSYFASDLDGDGVHALPDFVEFRNAFDAANGVGSFAAMVAAVPEPTSVALASLGFAALLVVGRRRSTSPPPTLQISASPSGKSTMSKQSPWDGPVRSLLAVVAMTAILTAAIERDAAAQLSNPLSNADGYDEGTASYQLSAFSPAVTRINTTGSSQAPGDDGEVDVNIGFAFNFYGIDYTDVQVNGNGHLYLGTGYDPAGNYVNGANDNSAHPENNGGSIHTNYSGPRLDFFWEDTDSTAGGGIFTETRGAAGSREFVVEYNMVPPFSNTSLATVQAILQEGTNQITYNYIDINDGANHRNGVAIGIQGSSDDYHQYGWFPGSAAPLAGNGIPADGESLLWTPTAAGELFHLEVNIDTGKISIEGGISDRNITGFEITSANGALNSAGFTGLGAVDQVESPTGATPGAGNDPGESWETLGATGNQLIQAFLLGNSLFDNDRSASLGNAFDTSTSEAARDVQFSISLLGGGAVAAGVVYVEGGDPADLNQDGFVDGLDLGIQLGNFNQVAGPEGGELNGTPPVDGLDLGILLGAWNPPALSGVTAVPEPTSLVLAGLGLAGLGLAGRRR